MPFGAPASAATMTFASAPGISGWSAGVSVSKVTGTSFTRTLPSFVTVSVMDTRVWIGSARPCGRFTCSECRFCIVREAIMKVASRKNMTSIMGMISIRPRRDLRTLGIRMVMSLLVEPDVVDEACPETLHLVHKPCLPLRNEVEREKRGQRDEESHCCCDQRLGHPSRHAARVHQALLPEEMKGPDHSCDGPKEPEKRGSSHDGFEHPEPARERLFDKARLVRCTRLHPPRRPPSVRQDHAKEPNEKVPWVERTEVVLELRPVKSE